MEIILPSFSVSSINVIEGSALVFIIFERLPDVYKDNARSANIVAIYIIIIIAVSHTGIPGVKEKKHTETTEDKD